MIKLTEIVEVENETWQGAKFRCVLRYPLQGMSRRCVVDRVCCCAAAVLLLLLCCCLAAAVLLLSCCCAAAVVTYGYLFSVFLKNAASRCQSIIFFGDLMNFKNDKADRNRGG